MLHLDALGWSALLQNGATGAAELGAALRSCRFCGFAIALLPPRLDLLLEGLGDL